MANTTEYITRPGDRWDLVAYRAYGTVNMILTAEGEEVNAMSYLIRNNPGISTVDILDAGLLMQIPIIPATDVPLPADSLPPWKQ